MFSGTGSAGAAGGAGFISENGLAEAHRFHHTTRPLEGRLRIPRAAATNRAGAPFSG